jgi:hypothetical protein
MMHTSPFPLKSTRKHVEEEALTSPLYCHLPREGEDGPSSSSMAVEE